MLLNYFHCLRNLFRRLFLVVLLLISLKICFYIFNRSHFSDSSISTLLSYLFWGLRFDLSAVFSINGLYIVLSILPFPFIFKEIYQKLLKVLFVLSNAVLYLIECADIAYFPFSQKRLTADVFSLIGNKHDFINLVPAFLHDYWYCILIWAIAAVVTLVLYGKFPYRQKIEKEPFYWILPIIYLLTLTLSVLIVRGGTQIKPIQNAFAVMYAPPGHAPLVLNSTFSLTHSFNKSLTHRVYFSDSVLTTLYDPVKKPSPALPFQEKNVVIIILESFSAEYTALGGRKSYTPFLDSLMTQSIVFNNAFSNGRRSNEGVPAIISGMPSWMGNPYISSAYSTNRINSIASLLKVKGYQTAFFHGADNGSMYFDKYMKTAGFDAYYGRNEFNDDSKYDNSWGIWDEHFFKFYLKEMNKMQAPFCTAIFSLSSHHPFSLPEEYEGRFPQGNLPIHPVVAYTDWVLKNFFDAASKTPWYANTVFVITADHTGPSNDQFYLNPVGSYKIPLLIYDPSRNTEGEKIGTAAQQIDIMPTILEYLHYPEAYFSFGSNLLDQSLPHFALSFLNSTYQFVYDDYFMQFDGTKTLGLYHLPTDSMLQVNLAETDRSIAAVMEEKLKAVIQSYHQRLLQNQTTIH